MLQSILSELCKRVRINGQGIKVLLLVLGAIGLVSGAFALNASLKAGTKTERFEKVLFGSQIATGCVLVLIAAANLAC